MNNIMEMKSGNDKIRIKVPEGLNEEERKSYIAMLEAATSDEATFIRTASEILARQPDASERIVKAHKARALEQIARALASTDGPDLLDLSISTLHSLLNLGVNSLRPLLDAVQTRQHLGIIIDESDIPGILDLAKVAKVMEEGTDSDKMDMIGEAIPRAMKKQPLWKY